MPTYLNIHLDDEDTLPAPPDEPPSFVFIALTALLTGILFFLGTLYC
jgi:hypothetical protein